MEEGLQIKCRPFVPVLIDRVGYLFTISQHIRENRVTTACGIDTDGLEQSCFTNSVLSGEQRYTAQTRNRKIFDSAKSSDQQLWKMEGRIGWFYRHKFAAFVSITRAANSHAYLCGRVNGL